MTEEYMEQMAEETAAHDSEINLESGQDPEQEEHTGPGDLDGLERAGAFELAPPEGIEAGDPLFGHFQDFVRERGWSQDRAQEGMEIYQQIESQKEMARQQQAQRAEDELRSEYGAGFELNITRAQRAVQRLTRPEFSAFLDESGLGNHPEMIRHFVMLDRLAGEDRFIPPDLGGAAGPARNLDGSPVFRDLARRG
jgi:hypothetical protein